MVIDITRKESLSTAARQVLDYGWDNKIWLFYGDMGAGKTTFIKAICDEREVVDEVSSPTFSLINEYETVAGNSIFHFDFYRIESEIEAENLGLDEYFFSNSLCLIEWPEKIPNLIPEHYLKISIKFMGDSRTIHLTKHGPDQGD